MTNKIDLNKDKIYLQWGIERCHELYNTGILFDGGKNPFVQAVFIEIMIRLRHLDHILKTSPEDNPVIKKIRDAGTHPHLNRQIDNSIIIIDFGRIFKGNWKRENGSFIKQDDNCDVIFQYGNTTISAKDIKTLIGIFEKKAKCP